MDKNDWSKTILEVYRYLPRVTYTYDKIIETRALNSAYFGGNNISFNSAYNVTNSIIDLSHRKIALINLKVLTEKALREIDSNDAKLLIVKYIDGIRAVDISKKYNVCLRTIFRKLKSALTNFSKALVKFGYNTQKLEKMLSNEIWIKEVYKQHTLCDRELVEQKKFGASIEKNIIMQFKGKAVRYLK